MTAASAPPPSEAEPIPVWAWAALGAALLVRLALIVFSPLELYPDEAQYWMWSRTPDWGYYSKPPLIAWMIGIATAVFGTEEWAVRLFAPVCGAISGALILVLGRDLFGLRAGLLAAALWLTMPGAAMSSFVISTDGPLLTLWSLMLLALFRLVRRPGWGWAVTLGAAAGFGFLAKYAMAFAAPALLVMLVFDARVRAALLSRYGLAAAGLAVLIAAPNLIWNAANGMSTVSHTVENAEWDQRLFDPAGFGEFVASQFGVAGLLAFPVMLAGAGWAASGRMGRDAGNLSWFVWSPLAIIGAVALTAGANANWAATAFPAGCLIAAGFLVGPMAPVRGWRGPLLGGALAANLALVIPGSIASLSPALVNAAGLANGAKRLRGWEETAAAVVDAAQEGGFDTVAFDDRFVFHAMDFYLWESPARPELRTWRRFTEPKNHAETCCALSGGEDRVLLVSRFADYQDWFDADFAELTPLGEIVIPLGGERERRLALYDAQGFDPVAERSGDAPPAE